MVEAIGNMTGSESWQQSGKKEHTEGEAEYNAAKTKGYAEGVMDRASGKVDAVVGAMTGDRSQEASGMNYVQWYSFLILTVYSPQETRAMTKAKWSRTWIVAPESMIELKRIFRVTTLYRWVSL